MENLFQEQKPLDQIISSMILRSYEDAKSQDRHKVIFRDCPEISDADFFYHCVRKVIGQYTSGRAFLQDMNKDSQVKYSRSNFFDSLKSLRRAQAIISYWF